jgi:hypothetical protein
MHPKIGDEPILLGFNRGLYTCEEEQSHPDDLSEFSEFTNKSNEADLNFPSRLIRVNGRRPCRP